MELTLQNSMLKSRDKKLKSPVFNPSLQNVSSPIPVPNSVTSQVNNLAENQGSKISGPTLLLPRWSKTGRRTILRKAIPNHNPSFSNDRSDDVLPLANQNPSKGDLPLKKRKPDLPTSSNTKNIMVSLLNENHAKFSKQYVCNICGRSFKCYQALGGHKVHHNIKVSAIEADSMVRYAEQHGTQSFVHDCRFCNKVFSTGQALGGHKRHCKEPVRGKEAHCNGESEEERNQKRGLNFDLNVLQRNVGRPCCI